MCNRRLKRALVVCCYYKSEQPTDLELRSGRRSAGKSPQAPRLGPHHSGPPARPTRPRAASAARRALAGSARVSVEGAGTGEHHMPALPSKGKSRDLSVATLIPSQAKPLLATDPRHAGHRVPSDRAPALRPGTALRMQRCAWQKRPTPAVLPVAQAWRGRVGVRLRTRSLPRQISRAMQRNLRTCYS